MGWNDTGWERKTHTHAVSNNDLPLAPPDGPAGTNLNDALDEWNRSTTWLAGARHGWTVGKKHLPDALGRMVGWIIADGTHEWGWHVWCAQAPLFSKGDTVVVVKGDLTDLMGRVLRVRQVTTSTCSVFFSVVIR